MNAVEGRGKVITNFLTFTGIAVVGTSSDARNERQLCERQHNEVPCIDSVEKFSQLQPVLAINRHLVNNAVHFR